ncbi:hypothetical protein [Rubrobacter tropicus]|uniref:hypothetical protein n=1 Tax=Rubrobacter tropicus TaxID=2653851 RepID=UPI001A9DC44C|nr:hypothetical protein [Rubrobacter tropicus]
MSNPYARHNEQSKANFDHVYDLPDPRGYFEALGSLDYLAPEHGRRLFPTLLREIRAEGGPAGVLDLCCSYGVNAALLGHDLTLEDLYSRYASPELADLPTEELAGMDRAFYSEHRNGGRTDTVGADSAANAVRYALRAGLLEAGFGEDLETAEPSGAFEGSVGNTGLVTVTGGVGYVWERTFDRVLNAVAKARPDGRVPWVATLPARLVDYGPLSVLFSRHGLVTEKLSARTFPQRRFADAAEREHVLRELSKLGVDPAGKEEEGWYHADLYLSRPAEQAAKTPVDELFEASGALDY